MDDKTLTVRSMKDSDRGVDEIHFYGFEYLDKDTQDALRKLANTDFTEFISSTLKVLEQRESAPIRIAVTGRTGSGKSTFINTIRGLGPDDKGAAPTGITETTKKATEYKHPTYDNIMLVDLPGVGTKSFPSETYFKDTKITTYDVIIVFYDGRFTEEEEEKFAKRLVAERRKFVFVRSKFDMDMANVRKRNKSITPESVKQTLKGEIDKNLGSISKQLLDIPVFFIDGDCRRDYEFPKLEEHLLELMPKEKKDALLRSLQSTSWALLEEKKNYLLNRIEIKACAAAVGSLQPVPGLDLLIDFVAIGSEISHYRGAFGFTENGLQRLSSETGLEYCKLKDITEKYVKNMDTLTSEDVKDLIKIIAPRVSFAAAAMTAVSIADLVLPFIGIVISAPASFVFVRNMLREILMEHFYPCAKEIQALVDETAKQKVIGC